MAGLGMALAGGLQGLGEGIVAQAEAKREAALVAIRERFRQAERQQDRQWEVEDRELRHEREKELLGTRHEQRMSEISARKARSGGGGGSGGSGGSSRGKPVKLTSGMLSRVERRFEDRMGETDYGMVDEFTAALRQYMAENPDATEDEAYNALSRSMVYEDEVTDESTGVNLGPLGRWGADTKTETNREGRGEFKGFDLDRDGVPDSAQQPRGLAPAPRGGAGKGEQSASAPAKGGKGAGGSLRPVPPEVAEQARNAVRAGADPAAVARRLRENGYDPQTISGDLEGKPR